MVASTLLVEADLSGTAFGGAFVPTDVTRFVRLVDGITINSWRQDALSQIAPSTLALTLDNDALPGDATAPNAGRFTPGLSTSPWSGKLLPGVRFRVSETISGVTTKLFDGLALDFTTAPGGDDGTFPTTVVNCVDILAWMGTLQPLRAIVLEEMLSDSPQALYVLDEPSGSTTAGDLTGNNAVATLVNSPAGAGTFAFGQAGKFVGIGSAAAASSPDYNISGGTPYSRGTYLSVPAAIPASGAFTLGLGFTAPASAPSTDSECLLSQGNLTTSFTRLNVFINSAGKITFYLGGITGTGPTNICDGQPHYLEISLSTDGKTASIYLDGVLHVSTTVGVDIGWTNNGVPFAIGMQVFPGSAFSPSNSSFSLFAQYAGAVSTARALAHATAALTAFAGESTSAHVARLLTYRPNLGSVLDTGLGIIGQHNTAGVTLQQALLDTAKAEGGLVFADGQGRIVFYNRARLYDPAVGVTLDAEADLTSDYQARIDMQQLVNDMTVAQPVGAARRIVDAASVTTYGPRQQSDTYIVNSPRDAADAAGWLVANQKSPSVRTPSVAVDITTLTSAAQGQAVLARGPLDRIALSNLPTWAPPTDVMVQGRSIRITASEFTVSFFTSQLPRKTLRADAAPSANTKLDNGLVFGW